MISTGKTEAFVYQGVLDGALEITASGEVWRICPRRRVDLSTSNGYRMVKIMRRGRQVTTMAHRLVYLHFFGQIPPGLTINHKNGVRNDNRPENLEVATYAQQIRHSREVLLHPGKAQDGEKNDMAKLTEKAVREIRRRRAAGERLKSIAADFGVSDRTVSKIARGERWRSVS